jgi:hypothetical protein
MEAPGKETGTVELCALLFLTDLFKQRSWPNPREIKIQAGITGLELLALLDIPAERVAALILNHRLIFADKAVIHPGDRVALLPPGGLIFPELGCRKCRVV